LIERRKFSREFKLEAVKLVGERGVAVTQAARDLDLHVNVLRKWVREQSADPQQAFPGHGQIKPEQLEIEGAVIDQLGVSSAPRKSSSVHGQPRGRKTQAFVRKTFDKRSKTSTRPGGALPGGTGPNCAAAGRAR